MTDDCNHAAGYRRKFDGMIGPIDVQIGSCAACGEIVDCYITNPFGEDLAFPPREGI